MLNQSTDSNNNVNHVQVTIFTWVISKVTKPVPNKNNNKNQNNKKKKKKKKKKIL
jgi:hypothetical protein